MIRLFNVYYPTRTIVLLLCEALIVCGSFLLATVLLLGPDAYLVLNYEYGGLKILGLTILTLLCSYYFDLYEPQRISARWEIYFRLLLVLGFLSFLLSAIIYLFPGADIAHYVLMLGLIFLTAALVAWRSAYEWIIGREMFRERVYVLGAGERAQTIVQLLQARKDAGMKVVGWDGVLIDKRERKEAFNAALEGFSGPKPRVDRVIVALEDRRGEFPVNELLRLRFNGVIIEDAGSLLERLTGKLHLDGLHPSSFIYSEGFRVKPVAADYPANRIDADRRGWAVAVSPIFPIRCVVSAAVFSWSDLLHADSRRSRRKKFQRLQISYDAYRCGSCRRQVGHQGRSPSDARRQIHAQDPAR